MTTRHVFFPLACLMMFLAAVVAGLTLVKWPTVTASPVIQPQETVWRRTPPLADFQLAVLVDGRPVPQYAALGKTYIEALEGSEYELRIHNPFPERVAVALSVDGLNTIDARHSTAWNASKWVIGPYGTITIGGWQMSSERARRFYFTTEQKSYAAKLGQTTNLGVISAVFFRERRMQPMPVVPPKDSDREQQKSSNGSAPTAESSTQPSSRQAQVLRDDDYAATGIGRSVKNDVTWVNMDLDRQSAAEITIRYEYYSALHRLGVLPAPTRRYDPLSRREDSRGFSPEPQ